MQNDFDTNVDLETIKNEFLPAFFASDSQPAKVFNRVSFFTLEEKNEISFKSLESDLIISFSSGQKIILPVNARQTANAFVSVYDNILYVNGLIKSKITGREASQNETNSAEYDNKILLEDCKFCEIETGPIKDEHINTHDFLVMKTCKLTKVSTGQNSSISGVMDTSADVTLYSSKTNDEYEPEHQ